MNESGIFLVKKVRGITSYDVIRSLKKILGTNKIGHAGTLDPFACGLMIVGVNEGTKILPYLELEDKEYIGELTLGSETDTFDLTGKIIKTQEPKVHSKDEIREALNSFVGKIKQTPPKYSAIKLNGKPLYKYARENIDVSIKEREQIIFDTRLINYEDNKIIFYVKCNKGTYIRSLGVEIAHKLGEVGHLTNLRRISIGKFHILNVKTPEELELRRMISIKDALPFKKIEYKNKLDIINGKDIKLDTTDKLVVITNQDIALAIYEHNENDKIYHCKRGFRYGNI